MATKIKLIGVGGSGCNTCSRLYAHKIEGVELIAVNTDVQDLKRTKAHHKIQLGEQLTGGLGTGMNPDLGREAALANKDDLANVIQDAEMLFLACGLGGGTGSGAAPVIAELAKNMNKLTLAFVTWPFTFEGAERKKIAENAVQQLKDKVDTLLIINNDKIFEICNPNTSLKEAFLKIDELLRQAIQTISDLIMLPGFINVDFADVYTILRHGGQAIFGTGLASGENRGEKAAQQAISSPLLDISIDGSRGVLINIAANRDLALSEVEQAVKVIVSKVDSKAKVIFGTVQDKRLKEGEIRVAIIATRFKDKKIN